MDMSERIREVAKKYCPDPAYFYLPTTPCKLACPLKENLSSYPLLPCLKRAFPILEDSVFENIPCGELIGDIYMSSRRMFFQRK